MRAFLLCSLAAVCSAGGFCRKEKLIGERYLSQQSARLVAEGSIYETRRLLKSTCGWDLVTDINGTKVESKPVLKGMYGDSMIPVTRAERIIKADADTIFNGLTTPEGYQIIDPFSNPDDFAKALEVYPWCEGCILRMEKTDSVGNSRYVTLNGIDHVRRVFVSKSMLHPAFPGGSVYTKEQPPASGKARAVLTFGLIVTPLSNTESRVSIINWIDTTFPGNNDIALYGYLQPLYERIAVAFDDE